MATETQTQTTIGKLSAAVRSTSGKGNARKLRDRGLIPAVVYGKDMESVPLTVDPAELKKALDPAKRTNTVIDLMIEDQGKTELVQVMVKDYQVDTIKQTVLHADFIRVAIDQLVDVRVPLVLEGRPEGVKLGGTLHQVFRTLPVQCTPAQIPAGLSIDVSALDLNDSLQVKDLSLPEGVKIGLPESQTIVLVMAPKRATLEELEAAEGAEGAEGEAEEGKEGEGKAEAPAKG